MKLPGNTLIPCKIQTQPITTKTALTVFTIAFKFPPYQ